MDLCGDCVKRCLLIPMLVVLIFCSSLPVSALSVSAQSAVVINGVTGEVIWQKNCEERLAMASTTKIMTALLLCENADLDETIVTTADMVTVEGSSMGLLAGDTVSYRDLLYGMLLASGNDAANTVAIAIGGSVENFVAMMNERAGEMGLENTHFETPSGLDGDEHYSTARDMALLARCALENAYFAAACSSEYATLCYGNPPHKRTLKNHNRLLGSYPGAIGVKTGFTKKAGRCLVTAAKRDDAYVIAVTLHAPDDWQDHKALLDYGFSALTPRRVKAAVPESIPVVGGQKDSAEVSCTLPDVSLTDDEWKRLETEVMMPPFVYAPVQKGDVVGQVQLRLGEKEIVRCDILATESVGRQESPPAIRKIFDLFIMLLKAMV